MMQQIGYSPALLAFALALVILMPNRAAANEGDPPTSVARLAYVEGSVSFQPGGTNDWVAPPLNRPLTSGDALWSDRDGRAELQLDGSILRLSSDTAMSLLNLGNNVTQIQLSAGTMLVRVLRLYDNETYEIDTPNLAFTLLGPGLYRVTVGAAGNTTAIGVRAGRGEVTGGGSAYAVSANEYDTFSGTNALAEDVQSYGPELDAFDAWSANRDRRWAHSVSSRYVSSDVVGYEDLDQHGVWQSTPDNGYVWFPRGVAAGWAPYQDGHWDYIEPWGYTWVDDQSWGFAPFHYGRWLEVNGAWGWVPAPPAPLGEGYVRPIYAPALVAWVSVGAGVAWFALGPREVYVPSYPVSRGYVDQINVTNTTVNTTVVNNIYNTTIVNNTVNATNVTYVNRNVPGAVIATTSQAFTSAQPITRNAMAVNQRMLASAPVRVFAPAVVPTMQAVLGTARSSAAHPPAAIERRVVVARIAPPPPPLPFARRQQAIKNNGGKPLAIAAVRQIQAAEAPPRPVVRLAPPARTLIAPTRPARTLVAPTRPAAAPARGGTPAAARGAIENTANRPVPAVIHPRDIPAVPRPASPSMANSVLERQHLQEQAQLRAQQDAERQKIQQQQEREHQQLANQQAQGARRMQLQQQLEQQHQQQTQQLMQKHAQEQQQLLQRQQQEQKLLQEQKRRAQTPSRQQTLPRQKTPPPPQDRTPLPQTDTKP